MNTVLFYTVQSGDTLASIVLDINSAAGTTIFTIANHNSLSPAQDPSAGQVISIPYNDGSSQFRYQLKPGDTLKSVALALFLCCGVTEQLVLLENPGLTRGGIKPGRIIAIPAVTQSVDYPSDTVSDGNTLFAVKH